MLTIHFKTSGKKSFIYRVKGTAKELEQYRDDKIADGIDEESITDSDTGAMLYFISKSQDFQPSGTPIVRKENEDGSVRYWPDETEQSIIARQAMEKAALRAFGANSSPVAPRNQDDEENDEEEANMEQPKAAPKKASKSAKPRRPIA